MLQWKHVRILCPSAIRILDCYMTWEHKEKHGDQQLNKLVIIIMTGRT